MFLQKYFNARWYDPQIGRFTTEDPIRDGLNWYAYCSNNPLRFVDPSGLHDKDENPPSSDEMADAYDDAYGEGGSEWSSITSEDSEPVVDTETGTNNKPENNGGTGSGGKENNKPDNDVDNEVIVEEGGKNKYIPTVEPFKGINDADKWVAELEELDLWGLCAESDGIESSKLSFSFGVTIKGFSQSWSIPEFERQVAIDPGTIVGFGVQMQVDGENSNFSIDGGFGKYSGIGITGRYENGELIGTGMNFNFGFGIGSPVTVSSSETDQDMTLGRFIDMSRDLGSPKSSWPINR